MKKNINDLKEWFETYYQGEGYTRIEAIQRAYKTLRIS